MYEKIFKGKFDYDEAVEAIQVFNEAQLVDHEIPVPSGKDEADSAVSELFTILSNDEAIPEDQVENIPDEVVSFYDGLVDIVDGNEGDEKNGGDDEQEGQEGEEEGTSEGEETQVGEEENSIGSEEGGKDAEAENGGGEGKGHVKNKNAKEKAKPASEKPKKGKKKDTEKPAPDKAKKGKDKAKAKKPAPDKAEAKKPAKSKGKAKSKTVTKQSEKPDPFAAPEHRDPWGYGVDTSAARLNQALLTGPHTIKKLAEMAKCKESRVRPHICGLENKGHRVVRERIDHPDIEGKLIEVFSLKAPPKRIAPGQRKKEAEGKKIGE